MNVTLKMNKFIEKMCFGLPTLLPTSVTFTCLLSWGFNHKITAEKRVKIDISKLSRHRQLAQMNEMTWHDIGPNLNNQSMLRLNMKTPLTSGKNHSYRIEWTASLSFCQDLANPSHILTKDMGKCLTIIPHANLMLTPASIRIRKKKKLTTSTAKN